MGMGYLAPNFPLLPVCQQHFCHRSCCHCFFWEGIYLQRWRGNCRCRLRRLEIERSQEWDGMRSTWRDGEGGDRKGTQHTKTYLNLSPLFHSSSTPTHFPLIFSSLSSFSLFCLCRHLVSSLSGSPPTCDPPLCYGSLCVNHHWTYHFKISLVFVVFHF